MVVRVNKAKAKHLKLITMVIQVLFLSSLVLYQPISGKGLDDGLDGTEYLETSWITALNKDIIGSPLLADLERDGFKEILIATPHDLYCINSDGSLRWGAYLKSIKPILRL